MKELHLICNAHLDPVWQWDWNEGSIHEKLRAFMITRDKVREMGYESGTIDVTDPSRPTFSP